MSKERAMASDATESAAKGLRYPEIFENHLYTTKEGADLLGIHISTLKKWVYMGEIVPVRVGKRKLMFKGEDLKACLRSVDLYREEAGKLRNQEE